MGHTLCKMLSYRVVTILSLLFTFASLMPGKQFLIETDDATEDDEFDESAYIDADILDDKEDDVEVNSPPRKASSRNRQRLTYRDPAPTRRTPPPATARTPPAWSIRLLSG